MAARPKVWVRLNRPAGVREVDSLARPIPSAPMCAGTGARIGLQPFPARCQVSIIAVVVLALGAVTRTTWEVVTGMPRRTDGAVPPV